MKTSFIAAATLGSLVLSGTAMAQSNSAVIDATPTSISVKGGIVIPIDDNLRSASTTWGTVGVEYLFPTSLIRNSETFLSIDWFFRGTTIDNGNVFPIAINQRFYGREGSSPFWNGGRSYFFLGAGVAFFQGGGLGNDAKWMVHGGVGCDLSGHVFAEASAIFTDRTRANVRGTAVAATIGYRF